MACKYCLSESVRPRFRSVSRGTRAGAPLGGTLAFVPCLFIVILLTVALMAGELEASLYLSVTAFVLAIGPIGLKFREAKAFPRLRNTLVLGGLDAEKVEEIMERPARWGFYSFLLFVVSGFLFLGYYLIPSQTLGVEDGPLFIGSLFMYALGFGYLGILFASTIFSNVHNVFQTAFMLSRALRVGTLASIGMWVVNFELVPVVLLSALLLSGASGITGFGWVFFPSVVPSIIGTVVIVWTLILYLLGKTQRFRNRTIAVSVLFFLLPYLAFAVSYLLPS